MNDKLNEAAEKEWGKINRSGVLGFIDGAKSDAAKEYWYTQFQLEQRKKISDGEIEAMAEKEFPVNSKIDKIYSEHNKYRREGFIKAAKLIRSKND